MEQEIEILESGTSEEKIKILENLETTQNSKIIKKMISCLDDPDIKVRGESFSSLIINKNEIVIPVVLCFFICEWTRANTNRMQNYANYYISVYLRTKNLR